MILMILLSHFFVHDLLTVNNSDIPIDSTGHVHRFIFGCPTGCVSYDVHITCIDRIPYTCTGIPFKLCRLISDVR